jgi:hypothetical protein
MKARPTGPKTLTGSREAKRLAAVLLEVLSGERGPQAGCAALGISLSRYYVLETRALQGMIAALEPLPKGRQKRPEDRIAEVERERKRLERELARSQALLRASQRSLGLPSAKPGRRGKVTKATGKRKRRQRRIVRAKNAIAVLSQEGETPKASASSAGPSS